MASLPNKMVTMNGQSRKACDLSDCMNTHPKVALCLDVRKTHAAKYREEFYDGKLHNNSKVLYMLAQ